MVNLRGLEHDLRREAAVWLPAQLVCGALGSEPQQDLGTGRDGPFPPSAAMPWLCYSCNRGDGESRMLRANPSFWGGSSQGMLAQRAPPAAPTTLEAERRPLGGGWQLPCPTWSPASSHRDIAAIAGGVRAQSPKVPIWDSKRCWVISSLVMPSTKVPCFGDLKHHRC